jgi:release factor H-coupled RctB family protein
LTEKNESRTTDFIVNIIAKDSFIDEEAIKQINQTAQKCPEIFQASGMPDLHPGGVFPIGVSFLSHKNVIYPSLVGNDIGCGMTFYQMNIASDSIRKDAIKKQLTGMEGIWPNWLAFCEEESIIPKSEEGKNIFYEEWKDVFEDIQEINMINQQIGTIGGGNHFAELLEIDKVTNETLLPLGFDSTRAFLLVHSGSRSLGQKILQAQMKREETEEKSTSKSRKGITIGTISGNTYLSRHDFACNWARSNRKLIAKRFHDSLNIPFNSSTKILAVWHNSVTPVKIDSFDESKFCNKKDIWVHRKGAAPSDQGYIIIPGSRGAYSYLVLPTQTAHVENAFSLAHGAGRKLHRGKASQMVNQKYQKIKGGSNANLLLMETPFQSAVICDDPDLLAEEHQDAYKEIDDIIGDLVYFGLIDVIARFRPLVTYKMRSQ